MAHGHHELCGSAVKKIRELYPNIDIIAGNVCTAEGNRIFNKCGADCVKVGIGPGSICITRKQTGCGAPQFSSVLECATTAKRLKKQSLQMEVTIELLVIYLKLYVLVQVHLC